MNRFRTLSTAAAAALTLAATTHPLHAQVTVTVGGPPPACPYGYYDFAPYSCAPYGYYGPEWFTGGVFFGAGPWFHGPRDFQGSVNNHFDPNHGYHGPSVARGARPTHSLKAMHGFHANEMRDGHGHASAPHH